MKDGKKLVLGILWRYKEQLKLWRDEFISENYENVKAKRC